MGRKAAVTFTDAELQLMEILWRTKRATVADVLEALPSPTPSYNSVQTRLNILTEKHYAKRRQLGRAFVYQPLVQREKAVSLAVRHLVSRFFNKGSLLALRLISEEPMSPEELDQLERAIERRVRKRS